MPRGNVAINREIATEVKDESSTKCYLRLNMKDKCVHHLQRFHVNMGANYSSLATV